jgi:hypothetical protein
MMRPSSLFETGLPSGSGTRHPAASFEKKLADYGARPHSGANAINRKLHIDFFDDGLFQLNERCARKKTLARTGCLHVNPEMRC